MTLTSFGGTRPLLYRDLAGKLLSYWCQVRVEDGSHTERDLQFGWVEYVGPEWSRVWLPSILRYARVKNCHLRLWED